MFSFIYEDDYGVVKFDRYFSYLKEVAHQMPPFLREFACDESRYELHSKSSLHDSWVESIFYENIFSEDSNLILDKSLRINFLLSDRRSRLSLEYKLVESFECCYLPNFWPMSAVDLLAHEVRIDEDRLYSHNFQFDRNVWLKVRFRDFCWH